MLGSICTSSTMERSHCLMKIKVTFEDIFNAENKDELYDAVIEYLLYVVKYQDLTDFNFEEVKED